MKAALIRALSGIAKPGQPGQNSTAATTPFLTRNSATCQATRTMASPPTLSATTTPLTRVWQMTTWTSSMSSLPGPIRATRTQTTTAFPTVQRTSMATGSSTATNKCSDPAPGLQTPMMMVSSTGRTPAQAAIPQNPSARSKTSHSASAGRRMTYSSFQRITALPLRNGPLKPG